MLRQHVLRSVGFTASVKTIAVCVTTDTKAILARPERVIEVFAVMERVWRMGLVHVKWDMLEKSAIASLECNLGLDL